MTVKSLYDILYQMRANPGLEIKILDTCGKSFGVQKLDATATELQFIPEIPKE